MRKMTGKVYQSVHPVYSTMIWATFLPPSQFQRRRSALRARRRINSNLSHHLRQRTRMKLMKMQLQIRRRVQMANRMRRKKQRRIKRIFSLLMEESQMLFLISKPLIPLPGRNHSIQMPKHGAWTQQSWPHRLVWWSQLPHPNQHKYHQSLLQRHLTHPNQAPGHL